MNMVHHWASRKWPRAGDYSLSAPDEAVALTSELAYEEAGRSKSADNDPDARAEMRVLTDRGWLRRFKAISGRRPLRFHVGGRRPSW